MTDILTEYRKRHGLPQAIAPVTEGVLFLHDANNPGKQTTIAALVSSVSKSYQMCRDCHNFQGAVTLEIVTLTGFPRLLQHRYHAHFVNEFDTIKEVRAQQGLQYSPIAIPTARELEQFTWELFIHALGRDNSDLGSSMRSYMKTRESRKFKSWIDEAIFFAENYASTFQQFYDSLYSPLLINRKYLLLAQ